MKHPGIAQAQSEAIANNRRFVTEQRTAQWRKWLGWRLFSVMLLGWMAWHD